MSNDRPPVLVTGVSGYIATELAAQLLEAGRAVRGTVRSAAKAERTRATLQAGGVDTSRLSFAEADLLDADSWAAACAGVEEVYHVASPFFVALPKDPDELIVPAREGTLNVLRAATAAGVRRVVLTSSVASIVYTDKHPSRPYDEHDWSDETNVDGMSPYSRSKTIAEKAAWDYVRTHDDAPELVTVCPGVVMGPLRAERLSDSLLSIAKLMRGEVPAIPNIGFEIVDVRDTAELHRLAMDSAGAAGQRYACTAGYAPYVEYARTLRRLFPEYAGKVPKRVLPDWGVRIFALFDKEAKGILVELGKHSEVSSEKARAELGWAPRGVEAVLRATGEALIGAGAV